MDDNKIKLEKEKYNKTHKTYSKYKYTRISFTREAFGKGGQTKLMLRSVWWKYFALYYYLHYKLYFTALSAENMRNFSESLVQNKVSIQTFEKHRSSRSDTSNKMTSPDSRIFNRICLFREQTTKTVKGPKQKLIKCDLKTDSDERLYIGATRCCFHSAEGSTDGEILLFSKEVLAKCRLAKYIRIK